MIIAALCASLRFKFSKKIQAGNTEAPWKFHCQAVRSHSHFRSRESMGGVVFSGTWVRFCKHWEKAVKVTTKIHSSVC